ncbi:glucosaminidase domain-containing protein [Listeria booriae]|uniref:GW domain-containing glycosaminoglycan-binding protein n=1 Tax=Listeria booriae TaxID=1552123 RepID=A0A7X0Z062_9LIST|nr:glucosaminidase domain-containing protein [Listeria booriae]MBC1559360.1 GW domain-containing glycosaminoglycan-binding protein [Listeria booriae]MBC1566286.1 GW domain-containing glycosaminoglycan-binding protein [Listeria booriae]MBC1801265.1 GW domain-containing glycosaminoglycan-binding protein [Listeria booriae]MBC1811679.1 GW domain-containing glycosaminoglycan-binding protein [Listeria booriae]MBC1906856.1 GW domain-containing glycosaminoglycan-binding protein [Listeria booriae]
MHKKKTTLLIGILLSAIVLGAVAFIAIDKLFFQQEEPVEITRVDPQQEFINLLAGHAQQIQDQEGILTSITLAQAILESNWGESKLATEGRNLFGIKGEYQKDSVTMPTQEFENNEWITIDAAFRKYPTWFESLDDHAALFLKGTSWDKTKYQGVIKAKDYKTAANALQKAGYATDPGYAEKLIELIEQRNLQAYDQIYDPIRYVKQVDDVGTAKLAKDTRIWSSPPRTKNAKPIDDLAKYGAEKLKIAQEMQVGNGIWYQIKQDKKTLGWVKNNIIQIKTL